MEERTSVSNIGRTRPHVYVGDPQPDVMTFSFIFYLRAVGGRGKEGSSFLSKTSRPGGRC